MKKTLKKFNNEKCFVQFLQKGLTRLDICAKILNCIIIAYYAYFYPLPIKYVGKSQINVELRSSLFRFYLYTRM